MRIVFFILIISLTLNPMSTVRAQGAVGVSAFRVTGSVTIPPEVVVPTVVEVPVPGPNFRIAQFIVREDATGQFSTAYVNDSATQTRTNVYVMNVATRQTIPQLTDGSHHTNETFALPVTAGPGEVTLQLSAENPITAETLDLSLARNVALPVEVSLAVLGPAGQEVVVSPVRPSGTRLSFPETTASTWMLKLRYAQPLRITELTLNQKGFEASTERSIRFLARPGNTYTVYADPDHYAEVRTRESGNLRIDDGVFILPPLSFTAHTGYKMLDSDGDGIPDVRDNCTALQNPDQTDQNSNGRGDLCEDFDRDGIDNSTDNCIDIPNRNQADEDGDGVGDACDDEESRITEKYWWIPWLGMSFAGLVILMLFVVVARRPVEPQSE